MKKKWLMISVCLALTLAGCSNDTKTEEDKKENVVTTEAVTESTTEISTEDTVQEADTSELNLIANTSKLYMGDSLVDLECGPEEEPGKIVCKVKMGVDYNIFGQKLDATGNKEAVGAMSETVRNLILRDQHFSDVVLQKDTSDRSDKFKFNFSQDYPLADVEAAVSGFKIAEDTNHPAYFTREANAENALFYQIDENYTLILTYDGDLTSQLSAEDFAQELYNLVTPIE